MPVGTSVHKMYQHLLTSGYSREQAAKIAQAKTGLSLKTGRRPKSRGEYGGRKQR